MKLKEFNGIFEPVDLLVRRDSLSIISMDLKSVQNQFTSFNYFSSGSIFATQSLDWQSHLCILMRKSSISKQKICAELNILCQIVPSSYLKWQMIRWVSSFLPNRLRLVYITSSLRELFAL
jgi:hypothetical protein